MKYLAYGSNLNLKMMKDRLGKVNIIGTYILKDYKLVCDKYSSVTKSNGDFVPCGVFEIDDKDELLLDDYEDYPSLYRKEYIENQLIYIKNKINELKPTQQYIDDCLKGYEDFNFDKKILLKCFNEINK